MSEPVRGQHWQDEVGAVRVMAVVEGYAVARRKGCGPFLMSSREFTVSFWLSAAQKAESRS